MDGELLADVEAEQVVLGAMMLDSTGAVIDDVTEWIDPGDHARGAHRVIHDAIMQLHLSGQPHDPVAVAGYLDQHPELGRSGPRDYLHTLIASVPASVNGGHYAQTVQQLAVLREWQVTGSQIIQAASARDGAALAELADHIDDVVGRVRELASRGSADDVMTAAMFAGSRRDLRPPVIEHLLDHEDRLVLVGTPGEGKTTVLHQMAFAKGAGVHPFRSTVEIPAGRALIIDLENRPGVLARKFDGMLTTAAAVGGDWDPSHVKVWSRRSGLDLRNPPDQAKLAQVLRKVQPDFVVAGPINKMLLEDGSTGGHQQVARWWDRMQERLGFALALEHHPPLKQGPQKKREIRPSGSAVWEQWPEFGFVLEPAGTSLPAGAMLLSRHRGDREAGRDWPVRIERRTLMQGEGWPWIGIYEPGQVRPGGMAWGNEDPEPVPPVMDTAGPAPF
jgi:replicative DNA helicase